jgi:hypothetical protein
LLLCGAIDQRRGDGIGQWIARGFFGLESGPGFGDRLAPRLEAGAHGFGLLLHGFALFGHGGALLFGGCLGERGANQKNEDALHTLMDRPGWLEL